MSASGMTLSQHEAMERVLRDVVRERLSQFDKWGDQSHLPDGTAPVFFAAADAMRRTTEARAADGTLSFLNILREEVYEAFAETDPDCLRAELVQVAAVAVQWVEKLDRQRAQRMGVEG